jgi:hypothetical protein
MPVLLSQNSLFEKPLLYTTFGMVPTKNSCRDERKLSSACQHAATERKRRMFS